MTDSPARDYIFVDGVWKRRRMGYVTSLAGIQCARCHQVHTNAWFSEDGQLLCTASVGAGLCDVSLYVVVIVSPLASTHGFFVVDATLEDRRYLNTPGLAVRDRLAYLGALFPNEVSVAPPRPRS